MGAPTAQTQQPGVTRGGAVFRCSTESPDECQAIPFDVTGELSLAWLSPTAYLMILAYLAECNLSMVL